MTVTVDNLLAQAIGWLRTAILLMLLITLAATLLSLTLGFKIDVIRSLSPEALAYICGAFWLLGGRK